jgi:putative sugar O-methyltransferase
MMKLKYLRHPIRTANVAKALLAARFNMQRFASNSERHFRGDARYDLQNVTNGFASRIDDRNDDAELLERICRAYIRAVRRQQFAPEAYKATEWWERIRQESLGPVTKALLTRDTTTLRRMYRNFFRDPCAAGLLSVPYGMSKAYFGKTIKNFHRRFYLSDVLHRIDYWKAQTSGRFALHDLAGPMVGNPFGVLIEETLVRTGSEYQHYSAQKICNLLESGTETVAEIGGGYGGMAYYLLRDRPNVTYIDFDVPESIALTSYYLLKTFPQLTFLLYGEEDLTKEAIARADVILLPPFELAAMPTGSVDIAFSSHAMSDVSSLAMGEYLDNVARMTRKDFLYIGDSKAGKLISDLVDQSYESIKLMETHLSGWHDHKASGVSEVECLYHFESNQLDAVNK